MTRSVDVVVIGGGPAGYAAAIRLAQQGQRVLCVEKESVGGVCLNWGCIPSKALITTAQRFDGARHGAELGVVCSGVRLDLPAAQRRNRAVVKHHTDGVAGLLRSNGVELVQGRAQLSSKSDVEITLASGQSLNAHAQKGVVVATGAAPRRIPGFEPDGRHILGAREVIFREQLPEHLIVLGGGVIGVELGSAYARLGAQVSIVEVGDTLLPGVDPDAVRVVSAAFAKRGVSIHTGTRVLDWTVTETGIVVRTTNSAHPLISGTCLLVAAGFVPQTTGLGLERVGIALDERGHIRTDERCETNVPRVFAIGDIAGPPYLAHKAYKEAEVVADVISGRNVARDWRAMPSVIFSEPEIASVGVSEAEARNSQRVVNVGRFPFSALGRAMALGESAGFIKLIAGDTRLVGATVVGPEASELIAELTLAIEVGASLEDLALTVHSHPTLAEGIREAADVALGRALHVMNRPQRVTQSSSVPNLPAL